MVFIISISVFLFDQLTKFLARKFLTLGHPVSVIKGFLYFTLVYNRGAAFGILRNQFFLFITAAVVAIILLVANLKGSKRVDSYALALSLILAGAAGNLFDRLFFGSVIDFLDFRVWPVFNVADSAITIGVILALWHLVFVRKHDARNL